MRLPAAIVAAVAALRMDRGVAALIAGTAALALAALLPIASLARGVGPSETRLEISTVRGGRLGLPWEDGRTPSETQHRAVVVLFGLLVGMGAATLATAGVTIVALVAARDAVRTSDDAVRRSVGASRRTLRRAALIEAGAIALAAAAAGVAIGTALSRLAASGWPGSTAPYRPMVGVALVLGIAGFVLASAILPIVFARSRRMTDAEPAPRAIFGPAVAQFAAGLTVLVTGKLILSYAATTAAPHNTSHKEVLQLTGSASEPAELGRRYAVLLDRLSADSLVPSLTSPGAVTGVGMRALVLTDCGDCSEGGIPSRFHYFYATHHVVSPDSFQALGVRVLAGRGFRLSDRAGAPRVAVVNRILAERHFQHGQAIGRRMVVGDDKEWYTVVGIVDDPPAPGFGSRFQPRFTVYLSILAHPSTAADLVLGNNGALSATRTARREAVELLSPLGGTVAPTTMERILAREAAPVRWFGRWIALEGWVTLLIAAVGMFAVMRIWVRSLYPELGLRRASGSTRRRVLLLVLRQSAQVATVGLVAGWWFGIAVWNVLPTILRGAAPWDTVIVAWSALPLVAATLVGALWPGLGAMRKAPAVLLGATN